MSRAQKKIGEKTYPKKLKFGCNSATPQPTYYFICIKKPIKINRYDLKHIKQNILYEFYRLQDRIGEIAHKFCEEHNEGNSKNP